jgi:hypothetical protein
MAIPTYETLPRELQFGVSMIVFAIFMLLLTIRWLAKRHKPNERQKDYALVAIYMSLNAGFIGVISVLYYIFSTVFSG